MPFVAPAEDTEQSFTAPKDDVAGFDAPSNDIVSHPAPLSSRIPGIGQESTTYGGGRAPVASLSETLAEPMSELTNQRLVIPPAIHNPEDTLPVTVGKEAYNIAKGIPEFFSSDLGLGAVVAGAAAPTATAAGFTADLAHSLGKQILDTYQNWTGMTTQQKAVALTDIAGTGVMATLTGKGTVEGVRAQIGLGKVATALDKSIAETDLGTKPIEFGKDLQAQADKIAPLAPLTADALKTITKETPNEKSNAESATDVAEQSAQSNAQENQLAGEPQVNALNQANASNARNANDVGQVTKGAPNENDQVQQAGETPERPEGSPRPEGSGGVDRTQGTGEKGVSGEGGIGPQEIISPNPNEGEVTPNEEKNVAQEKEVTPAGETANPPVVDHTVKNPELVGMGGAVPSEFESQGTAVSIKNAAIDRDRAKYGMPPRIAPLRQSFGAVWDAAMAHIDRDPSWTENLVNELSKNPRPLSPEENAGVLHRLADVENEYDKATRDLAQAHDDGRTDEVAREQARLGALSDKLQTVMDVADKVGTEQGRGLAFRKAFINRDMTLAKMEIEDRASRGGRPQTNEERASLAQLHKQISENNLAYEKSLQEAQDRFRDSETARAIAEAKAEALKNQQPGFGPDVIRIAKGIVDRWDKSADEARARIQDRLKRTNALLDPTVLKDVAAIGRSYLGHAALDAAEFGSKLIGEFGDLVKDHVDEIYAASKKLIEDESQGSKDSRTRKAAKSIIDVNEKIRDTTDTIKKKVADGLKLDISQLVQKLMRNFAEQGITDRDKMVDAVHGVLKDIIPDLDVRDTKDAMSGYGDFKQLSKDQISVTVRGIKGELQQLAKLEDLEANKPIQKTGIERRTPTDEERRLIKQVEESKRRNGVVVTDPATQLKSALDGVKTRLRNDITDLERQIADKQKFVKDKTTVKLDAEGEALKKQRDDLKKQFDDIFGKPEISDEQRVKLAQGALERSIADAEAKIKSGDVEPKGQPVNRPARPELEPLKQKLDALRQQIADLRESAKPTKNPDERANQQLRARLTKRMADLQDRIDTGNFAKTPRRTRVLDPDTLRLKSAAERVNKKYQERLQANRLANRQTFEKFGDFVSGLRRMFVLSGVKVLGKLAAYSATKMGSQLLTEPIGGLLGHVPGIGEIMRRAPSEGRFAPSDLFRSYAKAFTEGLPDAIKTLTEGSSDLKSAFSKRPEEAHSWMTFFQKLHEAIKSPLRRQAFELSFAKRMQDAAARGVDTTDEFVKLGLAKDAYLDSDRALLLEQNKLANGIRGLFKQWEAPDKNTGRVSRMGKLGAVVGRVELPILTVPLNYTKEVINNSFGLIFGAIRARDAFKAGIDKLTPQEADNIARLLKGGSVGLAIALYGFYDGWHNGNKGTFGGFYLPNEKRKDTDASVGGMKIGNHAFGAWMLHNPFVGVGQLFHTIGAISNEAVNKHNPEKKGITAGTVAGMMGLLKESPLGQGAENGLNLSDPNMVENAEGRQAEGLVPQGVRDIAEFGDRNAAGNVIKRKPTTIPQHIKTGIPGARQTVPKNPKQ